MTDVRLVDIRDTELSVDEVLAAVRDPGAGGLAFFVGAVRDTDEGKCVQTLDYEAHPTASDELWRVMRDVADRHDVVAIAAVHRIGHLEIGDTAVIVAASAVHRREAFAAAHDLIDTLKETVPIWKKQRYDDGTTDWVGSP
ncbi:MAG: molybdopterin synthase catalytic subunit [Frankiaceae bacterium]|nr:molybdopterin synthase catalytic subunit [Frankiaceae bacterium]